MMLRIRSNRGSRVEKVNSSSRGVLTSGDYLILLVEKIMQEASVFFQAMWSGVVYLEL
jgi:hypothetical protein